MISKLMYKPHITCLSTDIVIQNGKTLTTDTLVNKSLTNGSEVYCIDTSECYLYDEENKTLIKTKVNSDILIDGEITPESVNIINTKVDNFINDVNERIAQADIDKVVELGESIDDINDTIGSEEMGTDADTVKGAIVEHTMRLNDLTQNMDNKQDVNYQQIADGTDLNNLKAFNKRYCTINNLNARSCINIPRTNVLSFELYIPQTSPVENETYYYSQILAEWNGNIWTRFYNESKWSNWVLIGGEQKSLDSGWKNISFDVGTINVQPQYRKKDNIVSFRGRITGITVAETTILTLPVGYRPSQNIYEIVSISNGRYSTIVITSTGQIIISSNSDNTYNTTDIYRIDNIKFLAD